MTTVSNKRPIEDDEADLEQKRSRNTEVGKHIARIKSMLNILSPAFLKKQKAEMTEKKYKQIAKKEKLHREIAELIIDHKETKRYRYTNMLQMVDLYFDLREDKEEDNEEELRENYDIED